MRDSTPTRRKWFQFRLRSLLFFVTLVSGIFAWLAYERRAALKHSQFLAHIRLRGFEIENRSHFHARGSVNSLPPMKQSWWKLWLGIALEPVQFASFWHGHGKGEDGIFPTLEEVEWVCNHPELEVLVLSGPNVTNSTLIAVNRLQKLRRLKLDDTRVTDEGIRKLTSLPQLTDFSIVADLVDHSEKRMVLQCPDCRITDAALAHIARHLPSLQTFQIYSSGITDVGVAELKNLPHLNDISLQSEGISGLALKHIVESHIANQVLLFSDKITDESVRNLAGLNLADRLYLRSSRLTDGGLLELAGVLGTIGKLELSKTAMSRAGILKFQQLRPDIKVDAFEVPGFNENPWQGFGGGGRGSRGAGRRSEIRREAEQGRGSQSAPSPQSP